MFLSALGNAIKGGASASVFPTTYVAHGAQDLGEGLIGKRKRQPWDEQVPAQPGFDPGGDFNPAVMEKLRAIGQQQLNPALDANGSGNADPRLGKKGIVPLAEPRAGEMVMPQRQDTIEQLRAIGQQQLAGQSGSVMGQPEMTLPPTRVKTAQPLTQDPALGSGQPRSGGIDPSEPRLGRKGLPAQSVADGSGQSYSGEATGSVGNESPASEGFHLDPGFQDAYQQTRQQMGGKRVYSLDPIENARGEYIEPFSGKPTFKQRLAALGKTALTGAAQGLAQTGNVGGAAGGGIVGAIVGAASPKTGAGYRFDTLVKPKLEAEEARKQALAAGLRKIAMEQVEMENKRATGEHTRAQTDDILNPRQKNPVAIPQGGRVRLPNGEMIDGPPARPVNVAPSNVLVDPVTHLPVYTAPAAPPNLRPVTGTAAPTVYDPRTGKTTPLTDAQGNPLPPKSQTPTQQRQQDEALLRHSKDVDEKNRAAEQLIARANAIRGGKAKNPKDRGVDPAQLEKQADALLKEADSIAENVEKLYPGVKVDRLGGDRQKGFTWPRIRVGANGQPSSSATSGNQPSRSASSLSQRYGLPPVKIQE